MSTATLSERAEILARQMAEKATSLSAKEAAALLGISRAAFYRHVAPKLPKKRHGDTGPIRYRLTDIATYNQKS
jgi:predicted DNA-binding transcriptional regulator AlpA